MNQKTIGNATSHTSCTDPIGPWFILKLSISFVDFELHYEFGCFANQKTQNILMLRSPNTIQC